MTEYQQSEENNTNKPLTKKQRREQKRAEKIEMRQSNLERKKRRSMLFWILSTLGIIVIIGAMFVFKNDSNSSDPSINESIDIANEWVKDNPNAAVTLIEYSDFECPFCASFYPDLSKLVKEIPDQVKIIYRHFPLGQHKNAMYAAQATEAAGIQGKFWEMHDMIFDRQKSWADQPKGDDIFAGYAQELGLNMEQYNKDFKSSDTKDNINADKKTANSYKVSGTPTLILNGQKIKTPRDYEELKKLVQQSNVGNATSNNSSIQVEDNSKTEESSIDTSTTGESEIVPTEDLPVNNNSIGESEKIERAVEEPIIEQEIIEETAKGEEETEKTNQESEQQQ